MIASLIHLVIYIIVLGIVVWLLRYVVAAVPMDEPFRNVANIAILVVGVLILILLLLGFVGVVDTGLRMKLT